MAAGTFNGVEMTRPVITKPGLNEIVFPWIVASATDDGAQTSVLNFGVIPAYSEIISVKLIAQDMGTSPTLDVGYTNSDVTNATYFLTAADVHTAASANTSISLPLYPTHDTTITGTIGGGAMTVAQKMYVVVAYNYNGQP